MNKSDFSMAAHGLTQIRRITQILGNHLAPTSAESKVISDLVTLSRSVLKICNNRDSRIRNHSLVQPI